MGLVGLVTVTMLRVLVVVEEIGLRVLIVLRELSVLLVGTAPGTMGATTGATTGSTAGSTAGSTPATCLRLVGDLC